MCSLYQDRSQPIDPVVAILVVAKDPVVLHPTDNSMVDGAGGIDSSFAGPKSSVAHGQNTVNQYINGRPFICSVWEASFGGDYLLIGLPQDLDTDYEMLIDHLDDERFRADLDKMNLRSVTALIDKAVITEEAVAEHIKSASLHTDDNALLEYSAPKVLVQARSTLLMEELYRFRSKPVDMLLSL